MHHTSSARVILVLVFTLVTAATASAQATRTWVSGVGDDANPCSRTAPCKTFAGAISKTAAGGQISVLDPGGFGAVTITKSISIVGIGSEAGIVAAGTNGIIVNAGVNDVVTLRGLTINGVGSGLNGIRFLAGKELHVEGCTIEGFTTHGVEASLSASALLRLDDVVITRVANTGVRVRTTGGTVKTVANQLRVVGGQVGVDVGDQNRVVLRDSEIAATTAAAVRVAAASGRSTAELTLDGFSAHHNAVAVEAQVGGTIRLGRSLVVDNAVGLSAAGGSLLSFGDNRIDGNPVSATPTLIAQQ